MEYCAAFEINKADFYAPIWHNLQDHVGKQAEKSNVQNSVYSTLWMYVFA